MEEVAAMAPRRWSPQEGFTIIEILLVIVIIGVLLAIAAPSFVTFTSSQKVKTASFDLYAAMMFARSEAIKRRVNVTIAPVSGDWKNGWTVEAAGVATPLRAQDSLNGVIFSGATSVVYRLDGRLTGSATLGVLIQPETADSSIKNRCVRVDLTGLPKTTNIDTTTCP
jgi:type IV fimbrial biogenesis protein FimT